MLQKILTYGIVLLIVVWVVSNPALAGDTVHSWISGIITFVRHLV